MKYINPKYLLLAVLALQGCSTGADMFEALGKDKASFCGYSTVTYGGFSVIPAPAVPGMGVYVHQHFCRSNTEGSQVSIAPDGTMSVKHGSEQAKPAAKTIP